MSFFIFFFLRATLQSTGGGDRPGFQPHVAAEE